MSEIKPAGYLTDFGEFKKSVSFCDNAQALYYSTDYEALQKENERLKVDLYGMKEAKKAQFNISKANQEESRKLLNEAFDDNVMKQQTIISLKYEIDGMQDLNATQAKRIEEHLELIEATAEFSKAFWEKADKHSDTRVMVSTFQQLERKLRTYLPASKNGE